MTNLAVHRDALLTVDSKRNISLFIDRIIMRKGEGNYTLFHLKDNNTRMYAPLFILMKIFFKQKDF